MISYDYFVGGNIMETEKTYFSRTQQLYFTQIINEGLKKEEKSSLCFISVCHPALQF